MPTTRNQAKSESESSKPPDSTAQSQHDTKTILFTKPTQIFDNVVLIPEPPNITADPRYTRLVASIQYLRRRLMQDEVLREPLLHVLKSLYKSATTKKKISLLRPIEPTHQDIIHFVDELWPDLYLVKPDQRLSSTGKSSQWDGVWGHTYSGVAAVPDARIQIIAPLIEQWQSHVSTYVSSRDQRAAHDPTIHRTYPITLRAASLMRPCLGLRTLFMPMRQHTVWLSGGVQGSVTLLRWMVLTKRPVIMWRELGSGV